MKRLISIAYLLLILLASNSHVAVADDLFSEVTIATVFGESAKSDSTNVKSATGRRVTGASSLQKLLQESGLTTQEVSSNTVAVALDAPKTKDKILNAILVVRIDDELINIGVPLVRIDESKVPASKLLEMMNQGRNNDAIYFVYSPDSNWFGIRRGISNQNVSPEGLVAELHKMVDFAQNTSELWQPLGDSLKTVESNEGSVDPDQKKKVESVSPPQGQAISLKGTWAASGSNGQGFGISFDGNKFQLAIVQNGKSSQSKGTWTMTGNQLTLAGEGMTITGTLSITSDSEFELTLPNQTPLKFSKS